LDAAAQIFDPTLPSHPIGFGTHRAERRLFFERFPLFINFK
jgi:hypothetical protein